MMKAKYCHVSWGRVATMVQDCWSLSIPRILDTLLQCARYFQLQNLQGNTVQLITFPWIHSRECNQSIETFFKAHLTHITVHNTEYFIIIFNSIMTLTHLTWTYHFLSIQFILFITILLSNTSYPPILSIYFSMVNYITESKVSILINLWLYQLSRINN